jgi:hypothetical protein
MTSTTPSSLGDHIDHRQAPYYKFTVFTWDAQLFQSICKTMRIEYITIEDEEYPYYSIFQFSCAAADLLYLIQRYQSIGCPFGLDNFNRRQNTA